MVQKKDTASRPPGRLDVSTRGCARLRAAARCRLGSVSRTGGPKIDEQVAARSDVGAETRQPTLRQGGSSFIEAIVQQIR